MGRLSRALRALLGRDLPPADHPETPDLEERVAALEELQTRRELEWADTRERLLAYLRRVEGRAARAKQLEGEAEGDGYERAKQIVAGLKFSKGA